MAKTELQKYLDPKAAAPTSPLMGRKSYSPGRKPWDTGTHPHESSPGGAKEMQHSRRDALGRDILPPLRGLGLFGRLPTLVVMLICVCGCSSKKTPPNKTSKYLKMAKLDGHYPIIQRSPVDGVEYCCRIKLDGETYCSLLSKNPDPDNQTLSLQGKAKCMAISSTGDVIAIGMIPMAGPNEFGHFYLADTYEIVFVDTQTFQETRRWQVKPPGMPLSKPGEYTSPIVRFDKMAFNGDWKVIATYYWKPTPDKGRLSVVTLWNAATGTPIRELFLKSPDKSLAKTIHGESISGLVFSPDGGLIALSGAWPMKYPNASQPDGFVLIWQTLDGSCVAFRPKGHMFLWDLCFDKAGTRIACWNWAGETTSTANVLVWSIPKGNLLISKRVKGRILSITRSTSKNAFKVGLEDGSDLIVEHGTKEQENQLTN